MDSMRYDHGAMGDHVALQAQMVAQMTELRTRAQGYVNQANTVWTQHGSNAAQALMVEINKAFDAVFATISDHGRAISTASMNALETDLSVAAGFAGL